MFTISYKPIELKSVYFVVECYVCMSSAYYPHFSLIFFSVLASRICSSIFGFRGGDEGKKRREEEERVRRLKNSTDFEMISYTPLIKKKNLNAAKSTLKSLYDDTKISEKCIMSYNTI